MAVLLVTYDLSRPGQNYEEVLAYIKGHPWAQLSESSYAIATQASPQTVFNDIRQYLDQSDNLYVMTLKRPYAGYGPEEVNDWLSESLTY